VIAAIHDAGLNYPNFVSAASDDDLVGGYPVKMYPYCVVVDADGRIAAHGSLTDVAETFGDLSAAVEQVTASPPPASNNQTTVDDFDASPDADAAPATKSETSVPTEGNRMTIMALNRVGQPISGVEVFQNHVFLPDEIKRPQIKNHNNITDVEGNTVITWPGDSEDLRLWVSKPG
jgi:hypothetical protein